MSSTIHRHEKPELGRKLAASVRKAHATDPLLAPWAERLETVSATLETAIAPRASDTAAATAAAGAAAELDGIRDDQWRALYYLLQAYAAQRHDPALAAAAATLLGHLMPGRLAVAELPYARESVEIDSTLQTAAAAPHAAALASLPGAAPFLTGLTAAQANFAAVVAAAPAARTAITKVVEAIHDAEAAWDGVLAGYVGTLQARFPGPKGKAEREKLLLPLREAQALEKSRATRRRTRQPAPTPATDTPS
jgi:hypothetical protein